MTYIVRERIFIALVATALFFFPFFALASNIPGGFPSGSVWVSKTAPVAGESIQIFAPIYDAGNEKISGDVAFLVDSVSIGSVRFALGPGETRIASFAWNAKEGSHVITAEIQNALDSANVAVALSGEKAQGITIDVSPAPPAPVIVQALNTVAGVAGNAITASTPVVLAVADAIHNQTEALRAGAESALRESLKKDAPAAAAHGQVLGAETYQAAAAGASSSFSLMRTFEEVALFIVSHQWIFYPLLIALVLVAFYATAKRLAHPSARPGA